MHLYLNYAKEHWTVPGENPPVGLILCSVKDEAVVKYALAGSREQGPRRRVSDGASRREDARRSRRASSTGPRSTRGRGITAAGETQAAPVARPPGRCSRDSRSPARAGVRIADTWTVEDPPSFHANPRLPTASGRDSLRASRQRGGSPSVRTRDAHRPAARARWRAARRGWSTSAAGSRARSIAVAHLVEPLPRQRLEHPQHDEVAGAIDRLAARREAERLRLQRGVGLRDRPERRVDLVGEPADGDQLR